MNREVQQGDGAVHVLSETDDVGVMLREDGPVPVGHKVALKAVPQGAPVMKYGHVIGYATQDIAAGEYVHSHNLAFGDHPDSADGGDQLQLELPTPELTSFMGIVR